MYTITKGELWIIRQALEEPDVDNTNDGLEIVNSILDKNVQVEVTGEIINPVELDEDELNAIAEEEYRIC